MIHLESDYNNGAHEAVLRLLIETNNERTQSYGDDRFSDEARQRIRKACEATHTACRFVTSWATTEAEITELEKQFQQKTNIV